MSSFKPTTNRFSSLKDDVNTFSPSNRDTNRDTNGDTNRDTNRDRNSQSFRQPRENRDRSNNYRDNRIVSQRPRPTKPKDFNLTESIYPSISTNVSVQENDTDVPKISDYLQKCTKTKEEAAKVKSHIGWTELRRDKKTNNVTVSYNGTDYFPFEDYVSGQDELREQEYKEYVAETLANMCDKHDQYIQDEYELYGEDSLVWQEHCRFQQYLIDYPDVDDDNLGENDGSDYDSYED